MPPVAGCPILETLENAEVWTQRTALKAYGAPMRMVNSDSKITVFTEINLLLSKAEDY